MVEIEPKKAKSVRRRQPRRPPLSPPGLPPRWGEGVAPPPTPQFQTPHVSPEATSVSEDSRPRRHHRGHRGYLQRHHSSTVNNSNSCQKAAKLVMIPQRRERPQPSGNHWPFLRPFFGSLRANGNCISTFYSPFPPFVSTLRNRKKESHFYSNNRKVNIITNFATSSQSMIHPYHQQQQYNSHIMYEYRFSENRIERWPLAGSQTSYPYPNSAESNSPPAWESAGSSPEFLNLATCSRPVRPSSHRPQRTTSPVNSSVISPTRVTTMQRRSALRQHGQSSRRGPAKSVQWVSDIKKKPQDISSDRKIVKSQVLVHSFFISPHSTPVVLWRGNQV